jgi:hypothetical protein
VRRVGGFEQKGTAPSAFAVLTEGLQELALDNTLGGVEPENSSGNFAHSA